jgi:hypothetical protein
LSVCEPDEPAPAGNPSHGDNYIYTSNYFHITALAAGDFHGQRRDHLVTAFSNAIFNDTIISKTDLAAAPPGNNPSHENNYIYHPTPPAYFHVTAMAAGSFKESLTTQPAGVLYKERSSESQSSPKGLRKIKLALIILNSTKMILKI